MVTLRISPIRIVYIVVGIFLLLVLADTPAQGIYSDVYTAVDGFGLVGRSPSSAAVEIERGEMTDISVLAGVLKGFEYLIYFIFMFVLIILLLMQSKDTRIKYITSTVGSAEIRLYEVSSPSQPSGYDGNLLFALFPAFGLFAFAGLLSNFMTIIFIAVIVAFATRTILTVIYFPAVPDSSTSETRKNGEEGKTSDGTASASSTAINRTTEIFRK
ncbi:hypothetical protein [Haloferax gibbonsii]|uniref:hypothetical protein n=1 Tax=Haloferax gibbonsii TaxID=35746 RepID=UPI0012692A4C|nr:hypothetical protein [Haloferax gibbonsii]